MAHLYLKKFHLVSLSVILTMSFAIAQTSSEVTGGKSEWVYLNSAGKLEYRLTEKGDRIMDFSYAGYMGGGVAVPDVPVKITVVPSGGDDTDIIQKAINDISAMPLTGNFRGTVLLAPGVFNISRTITITESGIVLRGSGSGLKGETRSTIKMSGKPFNAIALRRNQGSRTPDVEAGATQGVKASLSEGYVPSGASEFNVNNASGFIKGDLIVIRKPVTEKWIDFMQMHNLVRDGKPQTWIKAGSFLVAERQIIKISGNRIYIDVPLSDSYDQQYLDPPGTIVEKISPPSRLKQCGVENINIVSPLQAISHSEPHFTALRINGEDCWARDILIEETMNSVGISGNRITVTNVTVNRKAMHQGSSRPAEFAPNGTQVLLDRCRVVADNVWFIATGSGVTGPVVILNCEFIGDQRAESHQRWSTGMLYDNVHALNGGIDFRNRGSMGSGHGWSMGWGVAWNCVAKDYVIQNPPGAMNWMIGCIGESRLMPRPFDKEPLLPEGVKDSPGKHVTPANLYLKQLEERLGEKALRNIGY
jgi:hypothetical protein